MFGRLLLPVGRPPNPSAKGVEASAVPTCRMLALAPCVALAAKRGLGGELAVEAQSYVSTYEIIEVFPHDPSAFTQGLAFDSSGNLYESDGLYGRSAVRHVDVRTGTNRNRTENPAPVRRLAVLTPARCAANLWAAQFFGEGIVVTGNTLVQLTWKNNMVREGSALPRSKFLAHSLPAQPSPLSKWQLLSLT